MSNFNPHTLEPFWESWYIESLIGEGSYGSVYKIYKEEFGRRYYSALKIISLPKTENEEKDILSESTDIGTASQYLYEVAEVIYKEIQIMEELKGRTNIVSFEDHKIVPKENGIGYHILIRMELLTSLNDYVQEFGMTTRTLLKLGKDLCTALEICQKRNIIHRDIKPVNIFVSEDGDFKLGDFGIARQLEGVESGLSVKGTYGYMAPEVYRGDTYDERVDIYSLGMVMYYYLNNKRAPFMSTENGVLRFSEKQEALKKRFRGDEIPAPKNGEKELVDQILKACQYEADDRFATATEFYQALDKVNITEEVTLFEKSTVTRQEGQSPVNQNSVEQNPIEQNPVNSDEGTVYLNAGSNGKHTKNKPKNTYGQNNTYETKNTSEPEKDIDEEFESTPLLNHEPENDIYMEDTNATVLVKPSETNPKEKPGKTYQGQTNQNQTNQSESSHTQTAKRKNKSASRILKIVIPIAIVIAVIVGVTLGVTQKQVKKSNLESTILAFNDKTGVGTEMAQYVKKIMVVTNEVNPPEDEGNKTNETEKPEKEYALDLSNKKQKDYSKIKDISKVTSLIMKDNALTTTSGLEKAIYLTYLDLENNKIKDIEGIKGLKSLNFLNLMNNNIKDVSALSELKNLNILILSNNQIKDISDLSALNAVTEIRLDHNKDLKDISVLKNFKDLQIIDLSGTSVKDISALYKHKNLWFVNLSDTKVPESQIKKLKKALPDCNITK